MTETTTAVQGLLKELAGAPWCSVTGPGNDHSLEDTTVSSRPGVLYRRKKANPNQIYMGASDVWSCVTCGAGVLAGRVAHTVRDGLFLCSGSGEVVYEYVPYCPVCEKPPDFFGSPVYG